MSDSKVSYQVDHDAAEAAVQVFKFTRPDSYTGRKAIVKCYSSERSAGAVHVLAEGGENNLHYHANADILWMVLSGRARFYGPGDVVRGELGPKEGILMPAGARYWFESSSDEHLEMLQIKTFTQGRGNDKRIDAESRDRVKGGASQFNAAVTA